MNLQLPDSARQHSDTEWYKLLLASIDSPTQDGIEFPGFPSEDVQRTFVGSAFHATLEEAFNFYAFLKEAAARAGKPVAAETRFLDFGCGWGRYLRFAWKDVHERNLFGCDVNPMIVDTCKALKVPGQIDLIEPLGNLPHEDAFFDTAMAYSVFTHLPEKVHRHWVRELARVIKPGGLFVLTLEPRRFMDFIANATSDNEWHRMLAAHKAKLPDYYRQFDSGDFVFMPTNKGVEEFYGDAVVPLGWIREQWQPWFEVDTYLDDANFFWQAVLVVRRTGAAFPVPPARS